MNGRLEAEQHEAAQEIERLRLTDAEREAVAFAVAHGETVDASWRHTLCGLLERTSR